MKLFDILQSIVFPTLKHFDFEIRFVKKNIQSKVIKTHKA